MYLWPHNMLWIVYLNIGQNDSWLGRKYCFNDLCKKWRHELSRIIFLNRNITCCLDTIRWLNLNTWDLHYFPVFFLHRLQHVIMLHKVHGAILWGLVDPIKRCHWTSWTLTHQTVYTEVQQKWPTMADRPWMAGLKSKKSSAGSSSLISTDMKNEK